MRLAVICFVWCFACGCLAWKTECRFDAQRNVWTIQVQPTLPQDSERMAAITSVEMCDVTHRQYCSDKRIRDIQPQLTNHFQTLQFPYTGNQVLWVVVQVTEYDAHGKRLQQYNYNNELNTVAERASLEGIKGATHEESTSSIHVPTWVSRVTVIFCIMVLLAFIVVNGPSWKQRSMSHTGTMSGYDFNSGSSIQQQSQRSQNQALARERLNLYRE